LRRRMLAEGMVAPVASVTVPVTVPRVCWALSETMEERRRTKSRKKEQPGFLRKVLMNGLVRSFYG
jgi:MOSC domain-containing protein YiiM